MKLNCGHFKGWEVYLGDEDGQQLNEHQVRYCAQTPVRAACSLAYVECKDDGQFSICVCRPPSGSLMDCEVVVRIDGRTLGLVAFLKTDKKYITAVDGSIKLLRASKLAALPRSKDGLTLDMGTLSPLGPIEIILRLGQYTTSGMGCGNPTASGSETSVSNEKSKSTSDPTYVDNPLTSSLTATWGAEGVQKPFGPLCTFTADVNMPEPYSVIFTYCTREALELLGIIPKSGGSIHAPMSVPQRGRTRLQTRKLFPSSDETYNEDEVEELEPPKKRTKIEVIDLTMDEDEPAPRDRKIEALMKELQELKKSSQSTKEVPQVKKGGHPAARQVAAGAGVPSAAPPLVTTLESRTAAPPAQLKVPSVAPPATFTTTREGEASTSVPRPPTTPSAGLVITTGATLFQPYPPFEDRSG